MYKRLEAKMDSFPEASVIVIPSNTASPDTIPIVEELESVVHRLYPSYVSKIDDIFPATRVSEEVFKYPGWPDTPASA